MVRFMGYNHSQFKGFIASPIISIKIKVIVSVNDAQKRFFLNENKYNALKNENNMQKRIIIIRTRSISSRIFFIFYLSISKHSFII